MNRWRVLIFGKPSGRPIGSVMAHDEASARKKAIDFYEIEPAVLRVVAVKLDSAKAKPHDLVTLWRAGRTSSNTHVGAVDDNIKDQFATGAADRAR
jgi:hypothetical protein